jgi:hypothetical protein
VGNGRGRLQHGSVCAILGMAVKPEAEQPRREWGNQKGGSDVDWVLLVI